MPLAHFVGDQASRGQVQRAQAEDQAEEGQYPIVYGLGDGKFAVCVIF